MLRHRPNGSVHDAVVLVDLLQDQPDALILYVQTWFSLLLPPRVTTHTHVSSFVAELIAAQSTAGAASRRKGKGEW